MGIGAFPGCVWGEETLLVDVHCFDVRAEAVIGWLDSREGRSASVDEEMYELVYGEVAKGGARVVSMDAWDVPLGLERRRVYGDWIWKTFPTEWSWEGGNEGKSAGLVEGGYEKIRIGYSAALSVSRRGKEVALSARLTWSEFGDDLVWQTVVMASGDSRVIGTPEVETVVIDSAIRLADSGFRLVGMEGVSGGKEEGEWKRVVFVKVLEAAPHEKGGENVHFRSEEYEVTGDDLEGWMERMEAEVKAGGVRRDLLRGMKGGWVRRLSASVEALPFYSQGFSGKRVMQPVGLEGMPGSGRVPLAVPFETYWVGSMHGANDYLVEGKDERWVQMPVNPSRRERVEGHSSMADFLEERRTDYLVKSLSCAPCFPDGRWVMIGSSLSDAGLRVLLGRVDVEVRNEN